MYDKVPTDLNFVEREGEIEDLWNREHTFEKSTEQREGNPDFVFYDGPPTANGKPHIGHVETRVYKDVILRYHSMKGQYDIRKAGWDTHGLPVEIEVEKSIGINGKDQIEKYGVAPFVQKCKESVWKYKGMWEDFSSKVGFWADMEHPYVTYYNDYIESEWWSLRKIWDAGLLYKDYKVVPYCPRCGTPLSSHEVAQGYKQVKERSVIAKFKAKDDDFYYLAWTTTPWTLPSNVALCVNPDFDYVLVKCGDEKYMIAEALCSQVLGECEVLGRYKGTDLEMREYEPLFPLKKTPKKKCHYVTCDSYVTIDEGTGIVHIAPAFGEQDSQIGKRYDLPVVQLVDKKGNLTEDTEFPGVFVKDADKLVIKWLDDKGLLFSAPEFTHDYPFCWRCGTPLLYYARESWFIRMSAVRDNLVANNKTVNWVPESIGQARFGSWLENVQDWALSRDRYWGTPLPIWECECGERYCVGSIEELKSMSDDCPDDIELHKPYIDNVTIRCPKCGKKMHRVPEVIDCWYDSGSMPFAQWHYPFENQEMFKRAFPADYITEAVDQTRGWFYSLMAVSTLIFNKSPYKNVIVLGLVLDKDGQKMSKSKGNAVDPMDALSKHGADAIRWYFYVNSAPWLPSRFHDDAVNEYARKFMGTLWNTYAFWTLYADIDSFDPTKYSMDMNTLTVMDRWLLSRLNNTIKKCDTELGSYHVPEAAHALQDLVDEMSNWYVRRNRARFWAHGMEQDKINAYLVLYTALTTVAKLAAPMIPFMTEEIYQNIVRRVDKNAPESVHLCDYPVCDESLIDEDLERKMGDSLEIVTLARSCRNEANIKNRQPLAALYFSGAPELTQYYIDVIRDELNVKKAEYKEDMSEYGSWTFKPQLKVLGPRFGKRLGEIRQLLAGLDGNRAHDELESKGTLTLETSWGTEELSKDDLLVEPKKVEGFVSTVDGPFAVALDIRLTPELLEEGNVREIISKIQTMRKDADFNVMDHIRITASGSSKVLGVMDRNKDAIMHDVLGREISFEEPKGYVKEWSINGEKATFGLEVVD
ncbi:MAG: isoleucine--tRNA ligase [Oscillospiraceae bacterium]|jgi:isoleucyl-tRNA synthetase